MALAHLLKYSLFFSVAVAIFRIFLWANVLEKAEARPYSRWRDIQYRMLMRWYLTMRGGVNTIAQEQMQALLNIQIDLKLLIYQKTMFSIKV